MHQLPEAKIRPRSHRRYFNVCGLKKSTFGQTKSVLIVTWK